ncbi:hypothetical protein [Micromonospora sp. NPDC005206]|uniref:hypothetical protein n=1 Tax=Micromonospora sp. NPDC005206 TaxID=3157022 RepID=UPI0033A61E01
MVKKKDDWWGGTVCLDSLRFITQNDANARRDTFENVKRKCSTTTPTSRSPQPSSPSPMSTT